MAQEQTNICLIALVLVHRAIVTSVSAVIVLRLQLLAMNMSNECNIRNSSVEISLLATHGTEAQHLLQWWPRARCMTPAGRKKVQVCAGGHRYVSQCCLLGT
jgi:hypothetical protein